MYTVRIEGARTNRSFVYIYSVHCFRFWLLYWAENKLTAHTFVCFSFLICFVHSQLVVFFFVGLLQFVTPSRSFVRKLEQSNIYAFDRFLFLKCHFFHYFAQFPWFLDENGNRQEWMDFMCESYIAMCFSNDRISIKQSESFITQTN